MRARVRACARECVCAFVCVCLPACVHARVRAAHIVRLDVGRLWVGCGATLWDRTAYILVRTSVNPLYYPYSVKIDLLGTSDRGGVNRAR